MKNLLTFVVVAAVIATIIPESADAQLFRRNNQPNCTCPSQQAAANYQRQAYQAYGYAQPAYVQNQQYTYSQPIVQVPTVQTAAAQPVLIQPAVVTAQPVTPCGAPMLIAPANVSALANPSTAPTALIPVVDNAVPANNLQASPSDVATPIQPEAQTLTSAPPAANVPISAPDVVLDPAANVQPTPVPTTIESPIEEKSILSKEGK